MVIITYIRAAILLWLERYNFVFYEFEESANVSVAIKSGSAVIEGGIVN